MNTVEWGPHMWFIMHTISFNYPINPTTGDKQNYGQWFMDIKNVLPCKYCRDSYTKILQIIPIENYLGTRYQLAYWVYLVHNIVNQKLGKKYKISFRDVVIKYEKLRSQNCDNKKCRK